MHFVNAKNVYKCDSSKIDINIFIFENEKRYQSRVYVRRIDIVRRINIVRVLSCRNCIVNDDISLCYKDDYIPI